MQFVSEKKSTSEGKAHTEGHLFSVGNADELTELAEHQASMVAFICAMQGCFAPLWVLLRRAEEMKRREYAIGTHFSSTSCLRMRILMRNFKFHLPTRGLYDAVETDLDLILPEFDGDCRSHMEESNSCSSEL